MSEFKELHDETIAKISYHAHEYLNVLNRKYSIQDIILCNTHDNVHHASIKEIVDELQEMSIKDMLHGMSENCYPTISENCIKIYNHKKNDTDVLKVFTIFYYLEKLKNKKTIIDFGFVIPKIRIRIYPCSLDIVEGLKIENHESIINCPVNTIYKLANRNFNEFHRKFNSIIAPHIKNHKLKCRYINAVKFNDWYELCQIWKDTLIENGKNYNVYWNKIYFGQDNFTIFARY